MHTQSANESRGYDLFLLPFVCTFDPLQFQFLSDKCFAVSRPMLSGEKERAEATLKEFLDRLDEVTRYSDPYFMVKFWRVCLFLRIIDQPLPSGQEAIAIPVNT